MRRWFRFRIVALLGLAVTLGPTLARAEEPEDKPTAPEALHGYTLRQCLDLADHNHPNVVGARAKVEYMRAQLEEARFAPFSNFTLTAGAGPAPTFRGGQVYTQDREVGLKSDFGMAWRASIDGTIPLYTFGKITNTWRAAEAQIEVGKEEVNKVRNAIRTEVRRAYYGLQLARDGLALLEEAASKLDGAVRTMEKRVAAGEGDDIDLLRLKTARAELGGRMAEARRGERVALAALRFYTGVGEELDIPQLPLRPPKHALGPLTAYLEVAKQYRPEIGMARAGIQAREAQVALAHSKMLPDFGLALTATYGRAPLITDQLNPFVRDDANYLRYGFAVGFKWQLDFLPANARVHQAEAQLAEVRSLYKYALGGTGLEVRKAYEEAIEARTKVEAYRQANRLARQWMIKVSQGIDVGIFEERDLILPAREYAAQRFNYLAALMDFNMAISNLAEKSGWDTVAEPLELRPERSAPVAARPVAC
jgi:outer membrane protein TolC